VNSGHSTYEQQPFGDWLSKAKRKFVGATIHNSGQFAVAVMNRIDVYLFDDFFDAAEFAAKDPKYRLYDLSEEPVHKTNLIAANIKSQSDYEDRLYERRGERERAAQTQGSR
jgi:hypothetical protein